MVTAETPRGHLAVAPLRSASPLHEGAGRTIGAHAGRFVSLALQQGWRAEGLELNPQTAAYAAKRTGARIRPLNVHLLVVHGPPRGEEPEPPPVPEHCLVHSDDVVRAAWGTLRVTTPTEGGSVLAASIPVSGGAGARIAS